MVAPTDRSSARTSRLTTTSPPLIDSLAVLAGFLAVVFGALLAIEHPVAVAAAFTVVGTAVVVRHLFSTWMTSTRPVRTVRFGPRRRYRL
ncbi:MULTISPECIES: hypothetical protein [Haloferacaceae]|uniref:Uncharacterized protein n=1 Tax=Halorubrum glutamatedens TaxID=2707018 RepID=A0ABD5QMA3_9EURY|nr:hypothetical protein [Halobellus captivus]